jgi:hypothetical protein
MLLGGHSRLPGHFSSIGVSRPLGEAPRYSGLDGPAGRALIASFLDREPAGGWLSLADAEALLATHRSPLVASDRCRDLERSVGVARGIGAPVALKSDLSAPADASDIDAELLGLEGVSRGYDPAGASWNDVWSDRPAPRGARRRCAGGGLQGSRSGLRDRGRPRRSPRRPAKRLVPPATGDRCRGRRADRLLRGRRH